MPEFILNGKEKPAFNALPDIVQGFIEAMFFTEIASTFTMKQFNTKRAIKAREEGQDSELPSDCGFDELTAESVENITRFCAEFETKAAEILPLAYERDYDETQCGRDTWFTSQGHGVGFRDRDELSANEEDTAEYERLTNVMIENRDNNDLWGKALSERAALEARGIGARLTALCEHNEANVWFDAGNVHCEI